MFICPNKNLFSAYIDGEISSPLKEKLKKHLQECPKCQKVYRRYTAVHNCMQVSEAADTFDYEQSFAKLLAKRAVLLEARQIKERQKAFRNEKSWFSASIRIPVPAAAAAVLIFVLLPVALFFKIEDSVVSATRNSFTPILPVSVQKQKPIVDMDLYSLYTDDLQEYAMPNKAFITNAKLFTVSEFTRLYSEDENIFQPVQPSKDLKIYLSRFPLVTNYQPLGVSNENLSMIK